MVSTYTASKNFEKQGTGDNENTWGIALNTVLDNIDTAIAGRLSKSVAGSSNVTLTTAEARNMIHEYTGALTGNISVIVPTASGLYFVYNNTSGSYTLTVKTSAGTGIAVTQGQRAILACDGTNVVTVQGAPADGSITAASESDDDWASVASAGTCDVGASSSRNVLITGTTTITSLGNSGGQGRYRLLRFAAALTLTYDATALILPGKASITTAAGDTCLAVKDSDGSANWRIVWYQKADAAIDESKAADVASATTTNIWTTDGNLVHVTGTTTITSFGTAPKAGAERTVIFDGALTLTHNATTLKLPGGANITTAAGDRAIVRADTTANMVVIAYVKAAAVPLEAGRQTVWIPASAMIARTTNGAASGTAETSTNKIMFKTLDFDASTIEYAQFSIRMPKSWNEGTVTAVFTWSHASTTTNFKVSWGLQAVAISNDDAGDAAFGTAQYANDEGGTTNDIYMSPETSAITIAGTPQAEDWVVFQVLRKADDGTNDTLAIDARLHGVTLYLTTDAATDT